MAEERRKLGLGALSSPDRQYANRVDVRENPEFAREVLIDFALKEDGEESIKALIIADVEAAVALARGLDVVTGRLSSVVKMVQGLRELADWLSTNDHDVVGGTPVAAAELRELALRLEQLGGDAGE